jgi:peptide/nickel transport system substrate-binding protein
MRLSIGLRAVAVASMATLVLAACEGGTSSPQRLSGGKAVFAELPNAKPNYIFPLTSGGFFSVANLSQFQFLMYRPLYWFGQNGTVKLNSDLSLAKDPVYSDGGKTVTMKLKGWKWSDGQPITSRDIEFWQNLVTFNKDHWAAYSPGEYPDNVTGTDYPDANTAVFHLDKAYGSYFFNYNELSQVSPLPQHVWDKTSDSGTVGDYDREAKGAAAVYRYLDGQSKSIGTYDTNPLWQVVDGPWKLKHMATDGNVQMVPNPGYGGPVKPTLAEFDEVPFTTDTAEFEVIHSGGIDYGYIPNRDLGTTNGEQDPNPSGVKSLTRYTFKPWIDWQITYFQENFANADHGAIYKQLYFRQAMQRLVDQAGYIKNIFKGYAYPDYGPVPIKPSNNFADSFEQKNPYPFDVNAAVKLLQDNGWTVNAGGVSVCSKPGTGAGQCGDGVAQGAKASFKLEYASGTLAVKQEMEALKSDFSRAGIEIILSEAPFDTVISDAFGGTTTADMDNWGGGWIFAPDYYPTGDEMFSTDAGSNGGAYSDATNDANTTATTTSNDVSALYRYEDYLAQQLPVVWIPVADAQLALVKKTLHGWDPQDPLLQLYPENWYFTAP